jgi:hypothetical protein
MALSRTAEGAGADSGAKGAVRGLVGSTGPLQHDPHGDSIARATGSGGQCSGEGRC